MRTQTWHPVNPAEIFAKTRCDQICKKKAGAEIRCIPRNQLDKYITTLTLSTLISKLTITDLLPAEFHILLRYAVNKVTQQPEIIATARSKWFFLLMVLKLKDILPLDINIYKTGHTACWSSSFFKSSSWSSAETARWWSFITVQFLQQWGHHQLIGDVIEDNQIIPGCGFLRKIYGQ